MEKEIVDNLEMLVNDLSIMVNVGESPEIHERVDALFAEREGERLLRESFKYTTSNCPPWPKLPDNPENKP
jgi:hypothetical protein